jgi:hypothetical protein
MLHITALFFIALSIVSLATKAPAAAVPMAIALLFIYMAATGLGHKGSRCPTL